MSRIPQPSSSRPSLKPPSTPGKSRIATPRSPVGTPARTQPPIRSATPTKPKSSVSKEPPAQDAAPTLSIKEAIALKRAEAKKAMKGESGGLSDIGSLADSLPETSNKVQEEEDLLGRLSLRDAIEQARSTGSLNLATRSLPCLPSALFEIHLNLTPDPLKSVPNEPELPPSEPKRNRRGGNNPAWFEAQDLTVLKAWNNDIQEIQHEISLFGSLKTVDLHKNKITSLPKTFSDLTSLTILDLSDNALTSLPDKIYSLPHLTTLNVSHNALTALAFNAPFQGTTGNGARQHSSGGFFTPVVEHATTPLPHLLTLDASHNNISAEFIHDSLPVSLIKLDLSENPLGQSQKLMRNAGSLKKLKEFKLHKATIGDESFPPSLFSATTPFVSLCLLDLSETQVTLDPVKLALQDMKQDLDFDFSTGDPLEGTTRVLVGKQVAKEPWELELERRTAARQVLAAQKPLDDDWLLPASPPKKIPEASPSPSTSNSKPNVQTKPAPAKPTPKEVVKEAWEIEAEQGLLTEGGRRRARAAAALAAQAKAEEEAIVEHADGSSSPASPNKASSSLSGLSSPQYYAQDTKTLRLPPSAPPPTKAAGHSRAFSVATPSAASFSKGPMAPRTGDLNVPTPTLPLSVIIAQPFADSLRVLVLANRRADRTFALPAFPDVISGFLPNLEELDLEGCNLSDSVMVYHANSESGDSTPPRSSELIIPTLSKLFPSLRTLNLSYNGLTSASLTPDALSNLILTSPHRKGLRHLRLRGNRISYLDGFLELATAFKGNREVPAWKMEELDLRDNEIGKIPPELGLLPLDVFLVDGNVFRVPQRRVWEREGTKGLLSWLRGRIE